MRTEEFQNRRIIIKTEEFQNRRILFVRETLVARKPGSSRTYSTLLFLFISAPVISILFGLSFDRAKSKLNRPPRSGPNSKRVDKKCCLPYGYGSSYVVHLIGVGGSIFHPIYDIVFDSTVF
jgi:hypothetical protein